MEHIPEEERLFWPEIQGAPAEKRPEKLALARRELQLLKEMISATPDLHLPALTDKEFMRYLRAASYGHKEAFNIVEAIGTVRDQNNFPFKGSVPRSILEYKDKVTLFAPEIWTTPAEEIEETISSIKNKLQYLKEKISGMKDLDVPKDDEFLLRYLRAYDYHHHKAVTFVQNYFKIRADYPRVFKDYLPTKVVRNLCATAIGCFPRPDPQGRLIVFQKVGEWDPSVLPSGDMLQCSVMGLECSSFDCHLQRSGVITVMDMKGCNWNQLRHLPLHDLKLLIKLVQEYIPLKIKAIYLINEPYIVHLIYRMVRVFINRELDEKIHFLGSNLETLHRHIPPECLPSDYGGHLPPIRGDGVKEAFLQKEEEFTRLLHIGYKRNT